MGNRERGMRLTISHKILHREQFEGAEFIDDNSFLWFLTTANVGACHLQAIVLAKNGKCFNFDEIFRLHKSRAVNSMVAIVTEGGEFNGDNSFEQQL